MESLSKLQLAWDEFRTLMNRLTAVLCCRRRFVYASPSIKMAPKWLARPVSGWAAGIRAHVWLSNILLIVPVVHGWPISSLW
eukprot:343287-Pleurochrysis_carterae.AAC.8